MATINNNVFQSMADLSLWLKMLSGDSLTLADVPELVSRRWTYFRDNWPTLRRWLENRVASKSNPDYFRSVLKDMDEFITHERLKTVDHNPLLDRKTYYRFHPVFETILVEHITLTYEERQIVDNRKRIVNGFSKNDFLRIKRDLIAYRDELADSANLSDETYNHIYNRGASSPSLAPTAEALNLMKVVHDQISSVDFILANHFALETTVDPFALARQNANNPEVKIGQYSSGYLVKLHYGEDLQGLATRYLDDPNKWIDIAIANGLKEPYVDEAGEALFLISNGRGNQINVAATGTDGKPNINKLHVNQFVFIQSDTSPFPDQRHITGIKEIPVSGEIVLTLSGEPNLSSYLLTDAAHIRVFKPNTVNSSQFVLIPTAVPLPDRQDEVPWFLASAGADEKKTKVDIALDDDGGLQFTSNGDISLSYGLANAIQAIKLKLSTEQGSNRYHPEFGIVNIVGTRNTNENDIKTALINSISGQIMVDPRFDRVESLNVERVPANTVAYNVVLVVRLATSGTLIPISFAVTF